MSQQALELIRKDLPTIEALFALNAQPGVDVKTLALQELEYLSMVAQSRPELFDVDPRSIVYAVKSVIKKNLTLDPNAGLIYMKTRSVKTGKKLPNGNDEYVKVLEITETANGLISVARQCGQVLDIERPKIIKDAAGKVVGVKFRYLVPSVPGPRWEEVEFDESDFRRWATASHKENSRWVKNGDPKQPNGETLNYANPNYTNFKGGPDPEFIRAKAIRHGLKKRGTNPNEGRAAVIHVDPKKVVVDQRADFDATEDEQPQFNGNNENNNNNNHSDDYVPFEEMPNASDL